MVPARVHMCTRMCTPFVHTRRRAQVRVPPRARGLRAKVAVLTIEHLRDDLRAAGARWSAMVNPVFTHQPRQERVAYQPRPDTVGIRRREATSRMMRAHRDSRGPYPYGSCDLRSWNGRSVVPVVRDIRGCPCTQMTLSVVETSVRMVRKNPMLELAPPLLDIVPACGRVWLTEPYSSLTLQVKDRSNPESLAEDPLVHVRGWRELHTHEAMKDWLNSRSPLIAIFSVHEDFYAYSYGVYHHVAGAFDGSHCVSVIGYDDGGGYWIAQNTWGSVWGEAGYFRIAFGERGIDASMWGVEVY